MSIKNNLRWWLWVCLTFASIVISFYFGIFQHIYMVDKSFIALTVASLYLLTTGYVGYQIHFHKESFNSDPYWFISDQMQTLGQIGTVIGLIMMFALFSVNLDISQSDTMKKLMTGMAEAGGTALYATLSSLVFSVFLKVQMQILDGK